MRFIAMWRYGSIHLDLDAVVLKPLDDLGDNFAAFEYGATVAAGVMKFSRYGKGHEWVEYVLNIINESYKPEEWSYNCNGALAK